MTFQPGKPKTGGRQSGVPNKFTASFREAVLFVYHGLGGHDAFLEWARKHPTEYYRIAARLIPAEMKSDEDRTVKVVILPADHGRHPASPARVVPPALPEHLPDPVKE